MEDLVLIVSAAARVDAGVILLNEQRPGWFNRVSLKELDMGNGGHCILGQVFGGFHFGLQELGIYGSQNAGYYSHGKGYPFGFSPSSSKGYEDGELLKAAWSAKIMQLRNQQHTLSIQ